MAKRQSIHIPGQSHSAPIPMGCKIGNMVYSSGLSGRDQQTNKLPEDAQEEANNMFKNVATFMQLAGGTPDDIIHVKVLLKDEKDREYINKPWEAMFPDPDNRPARHALSTDVRGGMRFQLEVVAVL